MNGVDATVLPERLTSSLSTCPFAAGESGKAWYIWLRIRSLVCGANKVPRSPRVPSGTSMRLGRSISAQDHHCRSLFRAGDRAVVVFAGRSDHRRFDQRHVDGRESDSVCQGFGGRYVGETVEGGLARHVGRESRRCRLDSRAADVHDVTEAARTHGGQQSENQSHSAEVVHGHRSFVVVETIRGMVNAAPNRMAGVVDQHVHVIMFCQNAFDRVLDRLVVGDVAGITERFASA